MFRYWLKKRSFSLEKGSIAEPMSAKVANHLVFSQITEPMSAKSAQSLAPTQIAEPMSAKVANHLVFSQIAEPMSAKSAKRLAPTQIAEPMSARSAQTRTYPNNGTYVRLQYLLYCAILRFWMYDVQRNQNFKNFL
jgi:hypothetical protein